MFFISECGSILLVKFEVPRGEFFDIATYGTSA
jgi:hypothetical protein